MSPRRRAEGGIALVHDWLTGMRGGEKCLEALCELYPDAPIFTLLHHPGSVSPTIESHNIRTSFVQRLPFTRDRYRNYLPLFPHAIEQFDLSGFDLVISSSHCVAKGVRTPPETVHICYCHTPMRYIWNQYDEYFGPGRASLVTRAAMGALVGRLRAWDIRTAARPHRYIANSRNVRDRIRTLYRRDAEVIYPPVNVAEAAASFRDDGYFLMITAMVPYKRVDLAIQAFNRLRERLILVGTGPELPALRTMAGPHVEFRGWTSDVEIHELLAGCRAVIFPGEEDFGIVPVEAMAHGKPVVALSRGGALETVREGGDGATGVFFDEQTPEALMDAVARLKASAFDPAAIRNSVAGFDKQEFKRKIRLFVDTEGVPLNSK
jgi:glycosyltransferase involved in cell wall biosynthesis